MLEGIVKPATVLVTKSKELSVRVDRRMQQGLRLGFAVCRRTGLPGCELSSPAILQDSC